MSQADTAEFSEFYSVNFPRIVAQVHAYLGDHAEAQDVTQEAFVRALDRWAKVSTYDHAHVWVRQVAWNLATSRLRHLQVVRRHLAGQRIEHVDEPSPDRVALAEALAALPPKHRLAIVLHHMGQLSTAEIAQQEGVAEGTVRSWLSRGRARLAAHFEESLSTADVRPPGVQAAANAVRRRRTARRATLAFVLALIIAIPIVLLSQARQSEPPIIGPTERPSIDSPTPGPTVRKVSVPGLTGQGWMNTQAVDGQNIWLQQGRTMVSTSDGGQTWRHVTSPETPDGLPATLYALGPNTAKLYPAHGHASADWLLLTRDGGETWTKYPRSSPPLEAQLALGRYQLWCPGSSHGEERDPCSRRELVKVGSGPVSPQPPWRKDVYVVDGADGRLWLVQTNPSFRIALSTDGANTWRELPKTPTASGRLEVSQDGKRAWITTDVGGVWEFSGDRWISPGIPEGLAAAAPVGDTDAWLVWQGPAGESWPAILAGGTLTPVPRYSTVTDKKFATVLPDGTVMVADSLGYVMGYGIGPHRTWVRVEF